MLTLDQVNLLENKVESLIATVKALYGERDALREALQKKDKEIEELSSKVSAYETEQAKIEERVVNALNQLDFFQSSVTSAKAILSQANMTSDANNTDSSEHFSQETEATSITSVTGKVDDPKEDSSACSPVSQDLQSSQDVSSSSNDDDNKKEEREDDSDKQMDIF